MSNTGVYSTSNYYPVTIPVGNDPVTIQIQNNLNSNVPSWSTHPAGFTLNLKWIVNGSGWGTTEVKRKVSQYHERFTNATICGGITQLTNSSTEVVWLRGGGTYFFKFSRNVTATANSSTFTSNGQNASPSSTAPYGIWNSNSGTEIYIANDITATNISATSMYADAYYDSTNTGYYVDPAATSNINGLTVAGTITGNISGNAGTATSAGNADTVDSLHASDFVRAYSTSNDNIDSDWGQSFKTFDPVPSGTPPIASPNLRTINIGENYSRRTQLSFDYGTNRAWFRRRQDSTWYAWSEFIHSNNINSYALPLGGGTMSGNIAMGGNSITGADGYTGTNFIASNAFYLNGTSTYINYTNSRVYSNSGIESATLLVAPGGNSNNWNTAYGWGNHASAGYLTSVTNISGNAATATTSVNLSGLGVIQSTSTGTSYQNNYQIRENSGGAGNTSETYAPQLAFHWGGIVASSIMMEPSGRIAIRNNPGSGYENFVASEVYAQTFIDLNDTNYYINPAGSSYVSGNFKVQQSSTSGIELTSPSGNQSLWIRAGYDTNGAPTPVSAPTNITFQSSGNSGGTFTFVTGNDRALLISGTDNTAGGSFRAPSFIDSNNTNYYLDPASTSILGSVRADNHSTLAGDGNGYGFWNGYGGSSYSIWMSDSSNGTYGGQVSGVGSGNDYNMYFRMNFNNRGFVFITGGNTPKVQIANEGLHVDGDIYADKFYDRNDTSYYVDPKNVSTFRAVYTREATVGALAQPDPSAVLDVQSTTQGFLPPRMSDAEMNAIASPVPGLMVWNYDGPALFVFDGGSWRKLEFA
jgi:hypothetical protein